MNELLWDLTQSLAHICPAFLQLPPQTPYPYIMIEPEMVLQGVPWGPTMVTLTVKIWSRYAGTSEILRLVKGVDLALQSYVSETLEVSLKIIESTLSFLNDCQTRVHTFRLKARLSGAIR
ncbi:MAG: DUF3168 domain-containing protein [Alphaproteobacteria bacterium]|nr:DUF3168 domain-containing protein [Alphaproteobacteria bacterium]